MVQECNALNELGSNACLNLETGEQYFYQPYSASNYQDDEKLKTEMEVNLQGNPVVNQVISNFEIPRPMYNNGHQAWVLSSGPCGIAMFDGNSYHQVRSSFTFILSFIYVQDNLIFYACSSALGYLDLSLSVRHGYVSNTDMFDFFSKFSHVFGGSFEIHITILTYGGYRCWTRILQKK